MTESEFNRWLSTHDFTRGATKYKIKIPATENLLDIKNSCTKTNAFVLPQEIEREFKLYSADKGTEFLPYNMLNGCFDVELARSRFEYINSQMKHFSDMTSFEHDLHNTEMHLEGLTLNDLLDEESDDDDNDKSDGNDHGTIATCKDSSSRPNATCTLENERQRFRKEDEEFWQVYNSISSRVHNAISSNNEEQFIQTIKSMATENLEKHVDHLKRSLLHIAIEKADNQLTKAIICSGFNVNKKEGCGLTPLHLAIMSSNTNMVQFLSTEMQDLTGLCFLVFLYRKVWRKN